MAVSFTVAASSKDLQPGWRVSETLNGRNVMTGAINSLDGTYRPTNGSVVEFTDGATVYFKGIINDLDEGGLGGYGATPIQVAFGAPDYNAYADWRQMELTIAAGGNLKSGLTKIATALSGYGVTLHASQANGPTFTEAFALDLAPISEILDKLSVATGYGWDIDYDKVLSMSSPGTTAAGSANNAPFNIAAGNGMAIGDITVKPSLGDFANVVFVRYSSAPTTAYAFFEMTANPSDTQTVTVGGKTYTFQTTLTNVDGNVQIDASYLVTITNLHRAITLQGTPGTDYAAAMTVNAQVTAGMQSDNSIRVVALQAGAGGNSIACTETCANANWRTEGGSVTTTLLFGTDETMNLWVRSPEAAASMPSAATRVDRTINHPEIRDAATAQLMADGYRARYLQIPNEIHYRTLTNGLHPGMQQSIVEAKRNLNSANCLITNVELSAVGNVIWYDITAVDALVIPPDGMEFWHGGGGGSGSGGGGGGSGVSITTLTIGANGLINSGATAWGTGTGFWLDYNAGTPRFRVGDPAGNQINWDGTNLKVQSLNLTIDQNGVLIAPDATARSEDNGYRFGAGFGTYGTSTAGPDVQTIHVVSDYSGFSKTARVLVQASATTDPSTASLDLRGVQGGASLAILTADTITLTGTLTIGSATYPGTATPSGAYLRANGTNWITSTLILPNAATSGRLVYASATNTYGESADLTYSGGILTAFATSGRHEVDPLGSFIYRHSNTAANSPDISLRRSRGTTSGTAAAVTTDDSLGALRFRGHDGTGYIVGASIEALIDDTVATNDLPTRLSFGTTPAGASSPVERMAVTNGGDIYFTGDDADWRTYFYGSEVEASMYSATAGDSGIYQFRRSRGTRSAQEIVQDGDRIGLLTFRASHDSSEGSSLAASLWAEVDGTPGSGDMPGALVFATTPAGDDTPVEALRIGPTGMATFALGVTNVGAAYLTGAISPTQLTANTDNWNPADLATANVIRIDVDAARNITGIVAQTSGRMILLHNKTAFTVTLVHDATSTAANRFYCPGAANFSLTAYSSRWIRYDGTHTRWTIA